MQTSMHLGTDEKTNGATEAAPFSVSIFPFPFVRHIFSLHR